MFERYTEKARRVIFFARYEASTFGSPFIETEHLLLGLLREDKQLAHQFFESQGTVESVRKQVEALTPVREKTSLSIDLPMSHESRRVLACAGDEADRLNHRHIGTVHLLLGLMQEEKTLAAQILRERGVQPSAVREEAALVPTDGTITYVSNLMIAQEYLKAIEDGATGEALARFFHPRVTQVEFPNRLTSKGQQRDLTALLEAAERGQKVLSSQSYKILHELEKGESVALEVLWEGTLAVPLQLLLPGATLRAHFAMFLEFRNSKIIAQRNYDCFDPFPGE